MSKRVLVTGVTGYIGNHVAAAALNAGYQVVGTLRSLAKGDAARAGIATAAPVDALRFVELDLMVDDGWDAAMQGIDFVLHVASPYAMSEPKDEDELISPAVEGTRRVIAAAQRAGVQRMVLTSSTVAVISGKPSGRYDRDSWSDVNADIGAYAKSKTLAERAAWDAVKGREMELVAINPGGVFGPTLSGRSEGQSLTMVKDMIRGKTPLLPDISLGAVDVRDVALLHVAAMTAPGAAGQRFIAATDQPVEMVQIAQTLKDAGYRKVSTRRAPTALLKIVGRFSSDVRGMIPYVGTSITLDRQATVDVLGWKPTAIDVSLRDTAASLS
jgi:dihydroflavonol-4-reductase